MNRNVLIVARWITSILLIILSIGAVRAGGASQLIGFVEIAGAVLFVIPKVWRIGGYALLAVIAVAIILHSASGHPPIHLIFPMLVIAMVLLIRP